MSERTLEPSHVWLVGCTPLTVQLAAALNAHGVATSDAAEAPESTDVVLVACELPVADHAGCCSTAFRAVPRAARVALLPSASAEAVVAAFAAGADDYVALGADPDQALRAVLHHVQLILSRRNQAAVGSPVALPLLPDPVIARPAVPDPTRADKTGLSCVVSTRGRVLRWSGSMGPFVAAAPNGSSFFELMHAEERPSLRNAALLLMAGEAAVDITARLAGTEAPVQWHLVMHPRGDRFLAIGVTGVPVAE